MTETDVKLPESVQTLAAIWHSGALWTLIELAAAVWILVALIKAQRAHAAFNIIDYITDKGNASLGRLAGAVGIVASTVVFMQIAATGKMELGIFTLYMMIMVASQIANKVADKYFDTIPIPTLPQSSQKVTVPTADGDIKIETGGSQKSSES